MPCNSDHMNATTFERDHQTADRAGEDQEFIPLAQPRTKQFNPALIAVTGIEAQVCADIARRQQMGIKKYGTALADNPAGEIERLQHAYEEALDLVNYLKWQIETKKAEMAKTTRVYFFSTDEVDDSVRLTSKSGTFLGPVVIQPGETLIITKVTK